MLIHQHLGHSVSFLLGIRYPPKYWLKLSSTVSMYQFPLIVSNMETRSTYSFSSTYPVNKGTFYPVLTSILNSLIEQVSHLPIKKHIFSLPDNRKNPLRNWGTCLMFLPNLYILPNLHYHELWEAYPPHLSYPVPFSCLGEHQHSVCPSSWTLWDRTWNVLPKPLMLYLLSLSSPVHVLVLPSTDHFAPNLLFSNLVHTVLWMCCISFTPPSNWIKGSSIS